MLTQSSLFNHQPKQILGLDYIPNFITEAQAQELMQFIDSNPWDSTIKRRTQHYGYRYNYKQIDEVESLGPIPQELQQLAELLLERGIFNVTPNQIIINEYLPGQGIAPHIDHTEHFAETVCSLSLESACQMDFIYGAKKVSQTLEPRSLLVFKRDARYKWQHGIAPRKSDVIQGVRRARGRRVSVTFRVVKL